MPNVYKLDIFVSAGDFIEPVTNHTKRAGFIITTNETRDEAIDRALHVVNTIEIQTVPVR